MDISKNERRFNVSNIIKSGYYDLDNLMEGFCEGELVLISGRPGMGKTSFALNIAKNVRELQNIPTVFFSLEMSKEQIVYRTKNKIWQNGIEFIIDDTPALSVEGRPLSLRFPSAASTASSISPCPTVSIPALTPSAF